MNKYSLLFLLLMMSCLVVSCVSHSDYNKALATIESLKAENSELQRINDELLNGENRQVGQYQEYVVKGKYVQAVNTYEVLIIKHPEAVTNPGLKDINQVRSKAKVQQDSIDKAKRDSTRLANINEMGAWKIGSFVNDFKEPTGEHFVYQEVIGQFSNSATSGSTLRVYIRLTGTTDKKEKVRASIEYDEYNNGTIEESYISDLGSKVVCFATRTVYYGGSLLGFYDKELGHRPKTCLTFADLLREEQTLEFTDSHGVYTTSIYNYTIDCKYLNNALVKAGLLSIDDIL